jgi:hypothetical protein
LVYCRSWAIQPPFRQVTTDKRVTSSSSSSFRSRIGSQIQQSGITIESAQPSHQSAPNICAGTREKRFTLARLSPLFGRKLMRSDIRNKAGISEPNTPQPSPALPRRRNTTLNQHERRPSPIRYFKMHQITHYITIFLKLFCLNKQAIAQLTVTVQKAW